MYLHLGSDVSVPLTDVVGVFDLDATVTSETTNGFFAACERSGSVINISEGIPKSFVIAAEGRRAVIYLSQLSAATLKRRALGLGIEEDSELPGENKGISLKERSV